MVAVSTMPQIKIVDYSNDEESDNKAIKKKRAEKGTGSIRKKGNTYEGRVNVKIQGKSKQISLCDQDKKVLIKKMAEAISQSDDYRYCKSNTTITVKEWIMEWINTYKRGYVKNSTLRFYIDILQDNIEPYIGNYRLSELTTWDIQKNLIAKLVTGDEERKKKPLSPKYIKEIYRVLDMALRQAKINGIINSNPMESVKIPKPKNPEINILKIGEQNKFEGIMKKTRGCEPYLFILRTGLRANEVAGLYWDDIDFDLKIMYIVQGLVISSEYNDELEKIKTYKEETDLKSATSHRRVPLIKDAYEFLLQYREQYMKKYGITNVEDLKGKRVFLTSEGNAVIAQFLWTKLDRLLKKVGFRHIRVHDLRHTFATRCLQAGMSIRVLQIILGHANLAMTEKYTHLVDDLDIEEMAKLQGLYGQKLQPFYNDKEICEMCGAAA